MQLIYSNNGSGWQRHFRGGTREVLQRLGPDACCTGHGRELFLQFRLFEISSSILFAYRSFLASPPWLQVLEAIWTDEDTQPRNLKERMLDLSTICTELCLS